MNLVIRCQKYILWRELRNQNVFDTMRSWERWECSALRRGSSGDLINVYKYLMCRNGGSWCLLGSAHDGSRDSGHKFKNVSWVFLCEGVQNWSKLPREVGESLSVVILKTWLDRVLDTLFYLILLSREFKLYDLKGFLPASAILWWCEILKTVVLSFWTWQFLLELCVMNKIIYFKWFYET